MNLWLIGGVCARALCTAMQHGHTLMMAKHAFDIKPSNLDIPDRSLNQIRKLLLLLKSRIRSKLQSYVCTLGLKRKLLLLL